MSAVGLPGTSASSATARSPDSAQHPDHWCRSRARSWPPRAPASSSAPMPTSRTSCPRTHTGPHVGFPGGIRTSRGFPSGHATEARRQPGLPPVAPHHSSDHTGRPISVCPQAQPCPPGPPVTHGPQQSSNRSPADRDLPYTGQSTGLPGFPVAQDRVVVICITGPRPRRGAHPPI